MPADSTSSSSSPSPPPPPTIAPSPGPAPAGLETPCADLDSVLAFHAANGGPFPYSLELEYATRRLTRAWVRAGLSERTLLRWLAFAASAAFGRDRWACAAARELMAWAMDERSIAMAPDGDHAARSAGAA